MMVRYRDGMRKSLVTHPGLNGEPSALPDGPNGRRPDPPPATVKTSLVAIRVANDRFNNLPRHEQIRLLEGQRIAWVLDHLGLPHSPENQELVRSVAAKAASERKPRTL